MGNNQIRKSKPKVSIITVCYNEENGIEGTCESVVNQNYNNYEWIVIDGGSTDKTLEILDRYKPNIEVLISEKDNGVYNAMNKGIKIAKGEYLLFLNGGDSFFKDNVLEEFFSNRKYSEDILFGDAQYLFKDGEKEISNFPKKVGKNYFLDKSICHQAAFIKKTLFDMYGMYDTEYKIVGDWEKWIVFNKNKSLFKKVPVVAAVHKRFDGLSTAKNDEIWKLHLREEGVVLKKHFSLLARAMRRIVKIVREKRYEKYPRVAVILMREFYGKFVEKFKRQNNFVFAEAAYLLNRHRMGVNNDLSSSPLLIVSLTSFPERLPVLHISIESLLLQKIRPHKVILWLSDQEFPNKEEDLPNNILRLKNNGLTIEYCKNIKSYKKLIPAIAEYPNDIIVTADDDIRYPENWLDSLYAAYKKKPEFIHCHRANSIELDQDGKIKSFLELSNVKNLKNTGASFANLISGCGGVLYPPKCFHKDVFDENLFLELCPNGDDIWFWAMAVLNERRINVIENNMSEVDDLLPDKSKGLHLWNANSEGGNDYKLRKMIEYYPQLKEKVLSS